jgi:transglutaminase-like putative cysteine protease
VKGRALTAVAILVAWIVGMGMLVRREFFRPHIERLAEAALRVTPGAVFYAVMQGDNQVGFASSTIDTSTAQIEQRDYLVADIPLGGKLHRATARTNVTLTRTLRVRNFEIGLEADQDPMRVQGKVTGDTVLEFIVTAGANAPETTSVRLAGPILLPTLVPLAVALEEKPRVGKSYVLPLFDPASMAPKDVRLEVRAESLFVVNDSSVFDSTAGKWRGVLPDTVRAWQIVSESGTGLGGWVDAQGRLVASSQMGFHLQRRPYEVAFENWRRETDTRWTAGAAPIASNRDVLETSAIAANKRLRSSYSQLRVRLGGVPLRGFDLDGGRQRLVGDTLIVNRENDEALAAHYEASPGISRRRADLKAEPFLEVEHGEIMALAARIANGSNDPRVIAQRINRWVYDSVRKEVTIGIPSALHVLHTRRGDCNEHAQLYVALARAAGIPARVASGLAYVDGKFYYHAWPEVVLHGWVAVDPTFGQFPADAAHLRFVTGGLGRQAELLRLVGGLTVDVIGAR